MEDSLKYLERVLRVEFKNKSLLQEALTHKSFLNENRRWPVGSNERLEFLGDAVIEVIVSTHLFQLFPLMQEGELTSLRAKLVNTKMLAKIGQEMGLYDYLYLSRGEARDTNPRKCDYLRACVFESIVGALFLDQGFEAAEKFLRFWLLTRLKEAIATGNDAKSVLQEAAQQHEKVTPVYELLSKKGPDHNRSFLIGVFFGNTLIAHGEGPSKQHAEQAAAEKALKLKGWSAPSSTAAQAAE